MAYITTNLGMQLADPSTIQAFETTVVNANFTALENAILADRITLTSHSASITTLNATAAKFNATDTLDMVFVNSFNTAKVANNTAVAVRTIPAQGKDCTIIVIVTARHGFDTADRQGAITLAKSAGTAVNTVEENRTVAPAGRYAAFTATWFINLDDTVASTLTFQTSSDDTEFWRGEITIHVVPRGKVN